MSAVSPPASFRLERDLVDVLRASSAAALGTVPPTKVLAETQVGSCIPDLLLFFHIDDQTRESIQLTYFDASILAAILEAGSIGLPGLSDRLFSRPEELQPKLDRLVRLELVSVRAGGAYGLRRGVLPQNVRIVAVEAKLSRWRSAIAQAREYFGFANESYIAMPADALRTNVTALDACAKAGVGVIVVDGSGAMVLLEAEKTQPRSPAWVRLVSNTVGIPQSAATARSNASRQAR
jgi:hypothetical protein